MAGHVPADRTRRRGPQAPEEEEPGGKGVPGEGLPGPAPNHPPEGQSVRGRAQGAQQVYPQPQAPGQPRQEHDLHGGKDRQGNRFLVFPPPVSRQQDASGGEQKQKQKQRKHTGSSFLLTKNFAGKTVPAGNPARWRHTGWA